MLEARQLAVDTDSTRPRSREEHDSLAEQSSTRIEFSVGIL